MLNILKQRYSEHKAYLTPWLAQYIKENHTYFPISYLDELTRFEIQSNGELAHIIQLPVPIVIIISFQKIYRNPQPIINIIIII